MKALVLLADGFEESEALVPVDVMRRAGVDVRLMSISDEELVVSSHGIRLLADGLLSEYDEDYDMVMLPGGMPGSKNLDSSEAVKSLLRKAREEDKWIAAICAAPMVLGHLGFLRGLRATAYPGFEGELEGAIVEGNQVEVDDKIITGVGAGASFDFGLALVKALVGAAVADAIKEQIKLI